MIIDREWVQQNLGFDPVSRPAPAGTFTIKEAAKPSSKIEDIQREIIEFDSEAPEGREFLAFTTATGLSRFTDITWPSGLEPKTDKKARTGKSGALPEADVLIVTWTVDEGHALSRVLTPGKDSRFSCFGPTLACAAPGVGIVSTVPDKNGVTGGYMEMDGTSMASPAACGTLAVILSKDATYKAMARNASRTKRAALLLAQHCKPFGLPVKYEGRGLPTV